MKLNRMIGAAAAALLLAGASCPAQAAQVQDFRDVPTTAWYYNAVEYAAREGLFAGTGADTFSPDIGMTRGMFVTVLGRKAGVSHAKPNNTSFADVSTSSYYAPYVEWAKENGVVSGTSATTFSPDQQITREQMAALLYRYIGMNDHYICTESRNNGLEGRYNGMEGRYSGTEGRNDSTGFADYEQVSPYAKDAMSWAVRRKIINGSGGLLDPQGTATRAQVAQVFLNAKEMLGDEKPVSGSGVPSIDLTPDQSAQLAPEQNPQELLRQVLAGTNAKWNPDLNMALAFAGTVMYLGEVDRDPFTEEQYWIGSTGHTAFNMLEELNDAGADQFCIKAWDAENIGKYYRDGTPAFSGRYLDDGTYQPSRGLTLYYTVPDRPDSPLLSEIRKLVEKEFPRARFSSDTIETGHGWRGYEHSDEALQIAQTELRYLREWYSPSDSFDYWISEPEPGKFYFYY